MRIPARLKFFFGAPTFEAVNPRLAGSPHQTLADAVRLSEGRVLDLCAGTGYTARLIASNWPQVQAVAVDLSPEMLRYGRRRAKRAHLTNIAFVRADVVALPFPDADFDVVTTAFGLHELRAADQRRALAEVRRVIREDGRFLIVEIDDPPASTPRLRALAYRWYMRLTHPHEVLAIRGTGLTRLLEGEGFRIDSRRSQLGGRLVFQVVEASIKTTHDDGPTTANQRPASYSPLA